jgi:hypothetical protein
VDNCQKVKKKIHTKKQKRINNSERHRNIFFDMMGKAIVNSNLRNATKIKSNK